MFKRFVFNRMVWKILVNNAEEKATLKYENAEVHTKYGITELRKYGKKLPTNLRKTQKYGNLRKMIKIKYKHPNE